MNNETDVGNGRQRLNGAEAFGFSFDRGFFKNDDVAAGSRIGLMNFDGKRFKRFADRCELTGLAGHHQAGINIGGLSLLRRCV